MAKPYMPYNGPVVTREQAKTLGHSRFFTGKPCKHGHLSQRTTCNGGCIQCNEETAAALYYAETPEKRKVRNAQRKAWKDANREKVREAGRAYSRAHREQSNAWKAANREKINAAARAAYDPEKARAYYQKNRAELLGRVMARYYANPEAGKRRAKDWKANNSKRVLELRQAWYAANKDLVVQRVLDWNAANPEAKRTRGRNYRARLNSAEGSHTGDDIKSLFVKQSGRCIYCNADLGDSYHVDHIQPLFRGGSNWPNNLQLLCEPCNIRKRATDPIEYARRIGLLL